MQLITSTVFTTHFTDMYTPDMCDVAQTPGCHGAA